MPVALWQLMGKFEKKERKVKRMHPALQDDCKHEGASPDSNNSKLLLCLEIFDRSCKTIRE